MNFSPMVYEIFFTGLLVIAAITIAALSVLVIYKLFKGQK